MGNGHPGEQSSHAWSQHLCLALGRGGRELLSCGEGPGACVGRRGPMGDGVRNCQVRGHRV